MVVTVSDIVYMVVNENQFWDLDNFRSKRSKFIYNS